ncbi:WD40-repeat-containing domain protein [Clohesyomyces aquaticus]|uniref:methylated diphthine methylhydrolase n=1 Tax=Clohesyomyces aquaticus TaxID=1231657 RepID=A0A1Y2A3Q2_9PLEO|nr:WD40-repeat-containing domain protein [Clohesyomyces aquaticus]
MVERLKSFTLDLPPSCVEFWPNDSRYAIIGTYNLEKSKDEGTHTEEEAEDVRQKKPQQRSGSLIIVRVQNDDVEIVETLSTASAILDLHFAPSYLPPSVFAVATSTGSIGIYQLRTQQGNATPENSDIETATPELYHFKTLQFYPEDVIVTAFTWHPNRSAVAMTLSDGSVCIEEVDIDHPPTARSAGGFGAHDLEAWTLAFLPDGSGLYSGGDDSALNYWVLNTSSESLPDEENANPITLRWSDKKTHGAGVTAIIPLDVNEQRALVLTGSYDDNIRLISAPSIGRRNVLAEMNLGGGVWRLKRIHSSSDSSFPKGSEILLLASCMHAGARILRLTCNGEEDWQFQVVARFEEHRSMNYGSDCQPTLDAKGQRTFISTSFYDRLLCVWNY